MAKRIQDFRKFNSSNENNTWIGDSPVHVKTKKSNHANINKEQKKQIKKNNRHTLEQHIKNKKTKKVEENSNNKKVMTFFLMLIIVGIGIGCLFSPSFNLNDIIVPSGENITSNEILNSFELKKGINVFKIDYKKVEESIEKLPYIQSANVNLELPNSIKIEYIERKPFALIKYLESYLIMDKFGYILEISREKPYENLPIIYNIEFDTYEIGKKLDDTAKTKYDNVVCLIDVASKNDYNYSIAEINYKSISNVKIWFLEEDIEIIFGEIDKAIVIDKLNFIAAILEKEKGKKGTLDVSSDNYLEKSVFRERL